MVVLKAFILILIASLVPTLGNAQDSRINFGNPSVTYPPQVTLADSLATEYQQQRFGSCHVEAATVIAEAACARKTGKKFSLSRPYLFYRHVRTMLDDPNSQYFLSSLTNGFFSENDPGDSVKTVERIISGSVMLSDQFTFKEFDEASKEGLDLRSQFWRLKAGRKPVNDVEFERAMRNSLRARFDEVLSKRVTGNLRSVQGGLSYMLTDNPENPLRTCEFQTLQYRYFKVTPERAVALINYNIPFICEGSIGTGPRDQHAMVYAGYLYNTRYQDNVGFYVRDSRLESALDSGWAANCDTAFVVFYNTEAAIVMKSLSR